MVKTFRFDDVCINADMKLIKDITDFICKKFENNCRIIWAVSPMVHNNCGERVFPKIYNAISDWKIFYGVDKCGIPELDKRVHVATHGLIHVDHRLLNYDQQEMSILISASLLNTKIFVPPFNKWNSYTDNICENNGIQLVKFEHGWKSMEYNAYSKNQNLWYLHAREWNIKKLKQWFGAGRA